MNLEGKETIEAALTTRSCSTSTLSVFFSSDSSCITCKQLYQNEKLKKFLHSFEIPKKKAY